MDQQVVNALELILLNEMLYNEAVQASVDVKNGVGDDYDRLIAKHIDKRKTFLNMAIEVASLMISMYVMQAQRGNYEH